MTRNSRRATVLAAATASALLALTACSSSGSSSSTTSGAASAGSVNGEIKVAYSGGGAFGDYMNKEFDRIRAKYPDLKITPVVYPTYDDELNQLPNEFAAGTAADIIQWDGSAPIAQYVSEQVIAPVDDAVKAGGTDLSAFPDSLIKGWTVDGKLYGLPLFLQHSGMAFNTALLQQAGITEVPATLEQVDAAAKAVTEKTGKKGVILLDNLFHISQWIYAAGGGYGGGKTINSQTNVDALNHLVGLFNDGYAATAQQLGVTWDGEGFSKGDAAMSDAGPWYVSFLKQTAPDLKYSLTPLPSTKAGSQTLVAYSGGFSVNAATNNQAAANAVLTALTDDQAQSDLLASGTQVPAMTKYVGQYRDATPVYAAFTDKVIADAKTLDYPPQTAEFGTDLVSGFEDIIFHRGATTPQKLLDSLQSKYGK